MTQNNTTGDGPILLVIKGLLIGVANIIPGVSGGTFALILGIYDRLISSLRSVGVRTVKIVLKTLVTPHKAESRRAFFDELKRIDFWFLVPLGVGAVIAILACSFLIDWLLANQPGITLAFFLGLIIPSIAIPWRMMPKRSVPILLWIIPGIALTLGLSFAFSSDAQGSHNPIIVFAAGAAAVSAMILPGISGSFLMLVMGQYQNILEAIQGIQLALSQGDIDWNSLLYLSILGLGIVIGLLAFARLLAWVLKRFRAATLAFLIGLVLGSFYVLWPFKDFDQGAEVTGRDGETKTEVRIATAPNRIPSISEDGAEIGADALALVIGLGCALGVERIGGKKEKKKKK